MCRLSVVVPSTHGGAQLDAAIMAVREQARELEAEIIVSLTKTASPSAAVVATTTVLRCPTSSILDVRAAGISAARGQIVALIEDHVIVGTGWGQATVRAHLADPDALLIGGAVENGSREALIDWANFLMTFGPFMAPVRAVRHERMPTVANLSLKREALPEEGLTAGELEYKLMPKLWNEGHVAFADEPRVWHVQSHGRLGTYRMHFANGRLGGAHLRQSGDWNRRHPGRLLGKLTRDAIQASRRKPLPLQARVSLPLVLALCCAHVAGVSVGAVRGPGNSAELLE